MIDSLFLRDFKGHRETTVRFAPLTVLVGPNGAGKTSVLEALRILGQIHYKGFEEVFAAPRTPESVCRHADGVGGFLLRATGASDGAPIMLSFGARSHEYVDVDQSGEGILAVTWEGYADLGDGTPEQRIALRGRMSLESNGQQNFWPELRSGVLLRLDAVHVAAASPAQEQPRVAPNGSGVASVLAVLKLTDEPRLARIVEALRRIVPQVVQVRAVPATVHAGDNGHGVAGYRLVFDLLSGADVPASSFSEGTLLTLAPLTVLHAPTRPRLLLLDDVHEALHPTAQAHLMTVLEELTAGPDAIQVIATTHSPFILDAVAPDAVQVFALRDDGTAAVRSLAEHPEAARYTGALSTGQLWTLDEERAWVLEGAR